MWESTDEYIKYKYHLIIFLENKNESEIYFLSIKKINEIFRRLKSKITLAI